MNTSPSENLQPDQSMSETTGEGSIIYMFGEPSETTIPPHDPTWLDQLNAARKLRGLPPVPPLPRPRRPNNEGPDAKS